MQPSSGKKRPRPNGSGGSAAGAAASFPGPAGAASASAAHGPGPSAAGHASLRDAVLKFMDTQREIAAGGGVAGGGSSSFSGGSVNTAAIEKAVPGLRGNTEVRVYWTHRPAIGLD
jgi:hypothetical protein